MSANYFADIFPNPPSVLFERIEGKVQPLDPVEKDEKHIPEARAGAANIYRVVVDGSRMTVIDSDRKLSEVFTKGIYDRFGEQRVQTILRVR